MHASLSCSHTNIIFCTLTMTTHAHRTTHTLTYMVWYIYSCLPFMRVCLFDGTSCLLCIHQHTMASTQRTGFDETKYCSSTFWGNRKYYILVFCIALSLNRLVACFITVHKNAFRLCFNIAVARAQQNICVTGLFIEIIRFCFHFTRLFWRCATIHSLYLLLFLIFISRRMKNQRNLHPSVRWTLNVQI